MQVSLGGGCTPGCKAGVCSKPPCVSDEPARHTLWQHTAMLDCTFKPTHTCSLRSSVLQFTLNVVVLCRLGQMGWEFLIRKTNTRTHTHTQLAAKHTHAGSLCFPASSRSSTVEGQMRARTFIVPPPPPVRRPTCSARTDDTNCLRRISLFMYVLATQGVVQCLKQSRVSAFPKSFAFL